jgi:hypothetical protein
MEAGMGWREHMIERHRETIDETRKGILLMEAGTLEMRSIENGKWVVVNDAMIARGIKTIETLERIISNAEAEIAAEKAHKKA